MFSHHFTKGDIFYDFSSASLNDEALQNWGLILKREFLANSFSEELITIERGIEIEISQVVCTEKKISRAESRFIIKYT